ncbi:MAG: leucyl aminopeptidase [Candidatus Tokpelaia sp.]|nr:MAG: leucyl aminopeptidase [Candidatus Tokpelaia sp.]KAA6207820.1 MAG: leucyl aminopeptidase [Candidatus Tokpelaia sp.]
MPAKSTLILLGDNQGRVAEEAYNLAEKSIIHSLADSDAFRQKRFAVRQTFLFPSGAAAADRPQFARLVVINAGDSRNFSNEDWLNLGGICRKVAGICNTIFIAAALPDKIVSEQALTQLVCGFRLRNYRFDKYKTADKSATEDVMAVTLVTKNGETALRAVEHAKILADSVILARNLVNEPANILGTEECIAHIRRLTGLGIEVEILDKQAMEREGLRALLAVAQGAQRPPYLAVMRWNGGAPAQAPLALIGKGVVFDSGGISLKAALKMEDMKGDMAGAAAVIGAMHLLAARKAKANIIGLVGLVENMPDGNAQRPGDIVTSLSGQTIEIVNTDAEGRLVLADVLWFAKERFNPCLMVDFASLTMAVIIALGNQYAGLYANNAVLSERLAAAGRLTGELLWPMPLDSAYDKKLASLFADMRNSCGREAGSVAAARFLQHFVGDTPWAHLDITGTAFGTEKNDYNRSWATGFGVRLINQFIADFYEETA